MFISRSDGSRKVYYFLLRRLASWGMVASALCIVHLLRYILQKLSSHNSHRSMQTCAKTREALEPVDRQEKNDLEKASGQGSS